MERTAPVCDDNERRPSVRRRSLAFVVAAAALGAIALGGAGVAGAQGQGEPPATPPAAGGVAATLEQCVTSVVQSERSATFTGEMVAIPGTAKMSMRIDVEERGLEEPEFHAVSGQGVGVWRSSEPKVKVYKYLRQVTNLSSPDSYRALVHFRWINAKGHVLRRADRVTPRCLQPASPTESTPPASTPPQAGASSSSSGSSTAPSA